MGRNCVRGVGTANSANLLIGVSSTTSRRRRVRLAADALSPAYWPEISLSSSKGGPKMIRFWLFAERYRRQLLHLLIGGSWISRSGAEVCRPHPAAVLRSTGQQETHYRDCSPRYLHLDTGVSPRQSCWSAVLFFLQSYSRQLIIK
jgi:hypothetical protein